MILSVRTVESGSPDGAAVVIEFGTSGGHTLWRIPVSDETEASRVKHEVASKVREVLDQQEAQWSESGTWLQKPAEHVPGVIYVPELSRFGEGEDAEARSDRAVRPL